MKSILCGIVVVATAALMAWAIAPWLLLLWLSRNYNLHIEVSPKDINIPAKAMEVKLEVDQPEGQEPEVYNLELEDYWQDDEPVIQFVNLEPVIQEIETNVETVKKEIEMETALVFPQCPKSLSKMTLRGLQLLCGDINKVKRSSIVGYRNEKDKQKIIDKLEAFYQSI